MVASREWHLVRRPQGWPTHDDVELVTTEVGDPGPGELLVRNLAMSVAPYMRGRMNDAQSYAAPFGLNEPMYGGAIGRVEASSMPGIEPGTIVRNFLGWREWAL